MSGKKYPCLLNAFDHQDNFPIIAQVLADNFSDLFQLDILEDDCQQGGKSAYYQFFHACVTALAKLYSTDEVVEKLQSLINFIKIYSWIKLVTASELNQWLAGLMDIVSLLVARGHSSVPDNIAVLLSGFASYLCKSGSDINSLTFKLKNYWHLVSGVMDELANPVTLDVPNLLCFQKNGPYDSVKRVIFMQLLNQGVLIDTTRGADAVWTEEFNDKLLKESLQQYVNETKSILDRNKSALSLRQEQALFLLSDELGAIGESGSKGIGELHSQQSQNNKLIMACGMSSVISTYQNRWFKSYDRKEQANSLKDRLEELFAGAVHEEGGYQRVILAIHKAKMAAIESDRAFNSTHYFKRNQWGYSRYLDALNQMHELVVAHWVRDKNSIQEFAEYRIYVKLEFLDVAKQLQLALDAYINETWLEEDDLRRQEVMQKIYGFFDNGKEQKFRQLSAMLGHFNGKSTDALTGGAEIRIMLEQIGKDLPMLSGDLATIAKDVLLLGKGLQGHLERAEQISFQPG